ncbi:uncharacterized protein LOC123656209 [Melitaea cinxia]|uniref:uncharacterized protein LOC123656209 n=1 Tax=Melitaea cinxia TaxID=113334 RepID=UPI001E26FD91|nr:uncharacterized protein LOC123656209 [Melitaea cinxia]
MPKTLRSGERELVLKVKRFCEREKTNKAPLIPFENVRRRVAAMTGISEKTVTKICQEGAVAASTSTKISTPGKSRPHEKRVKLDDFDLCVIRHKVHEFYAVRKEVPTLTKLLHDLKVDINFNGSRTSLWRIMRSIGFRFQKCKSRRKILMERPDIIAWRAKSLTQMRVKKEFYLPIQRELAGL